MPHIPASVCRPRRPAPEPRPHRRRIAEERSLRAPALDAVNRARLASPQTGREIRGGPAGRQGFRVQSRESRRIGGVRFRLWPGRVQSAFSAMTCRFGAWRRLPGRNRARGGRARDRGARQTRQASRHRDEAREPYRQRHETSFAGARRRQARPGPPPCPRRKRRIPLAAWPRYR